MLVGAAASLVNLIIHAGCSGRGLDRSRLGERDTFVPGFVQYTVVIVATGTLLMAGHFVEVMVWAITYGLVGIAPPGSNSSISLSATTPRSAMPTWSRRSNGGCSGR